MKDLKKTLALLHKKSKEKVKPTTTDYWQFEANLKHSWLEYEYGKRLEFVSKTFEHIGKEVYQYKDGRISYSFENKSDDHFNKTEQTPVILTQEMYDKFETDYVSFTIERLTEQLLTCSPFAKSTNAFSNLKELIEFEAKQEMVKELTGFLRGW